LVDVERTVNEAIERAKSLCEKYCGPPPEVIVKVAKNGNAPFMYVESHLHHMVHDVYLPIYFVLYLLYVRTLRFLS